MSIDVDALSKAAADDADERQKRWHKGPTLGLHAEFHAAFLCGWRYAMKQQQSDRRVAK